MKNIIGLGGSIHDFAACLIQDEKIIAIEDERLTRIRYALGTEKPCIKSLAYCLEAAGLNFKEIDQLAMNDDIFDMVDTHFCKNITLYNHHLTHAYSTFFTSNFDEAAILIVDGAGSKKNFVEHTEERETTTFAYGKGNNLHILKKIYGNLDGVNPYTNSQTIMTNSIGEFYRIIAEALGLGWLSGPGKLMGLAPYGNYPTNNGFLEELLSFVNFLPNGEFCVRANGKDGMIDGLYRIRSQYSKTPSAFHLDALLAWNGQKVLEMMLSHALNYLYKEFPCENVCIAGGVGLNSIANGKIHLLSPFKNAHIVYAPGDNGTAIGSAIATYVHNHKDKKIIRFGNEPYFGKKYKYDNIEKCLKNANINYSLSNNILKDTANLLSEGKIIGWFQGGSEFGPRALGNRSIIADPRVSSMKERINSSIKQREWFRPLAPAVLIEEASTYFDILTNTNWMQFVWTVKEEFRKLIPSITHIDGSARVQTVSQEGNSNFYFLIKEFGELTGIPIIINTSFNINGEPIVETPEEAIKAFIASDIDILVLHDYIISKK